MDEISLCRYSNCYLKVFDSSTMVSLQHREVLLFRNTLQEVLGVVLVRKEVWEEVRGAVVSLGSLEGGNIHD